MAGKRANRHDVNLIIGGTSAARAHVRTHVLAANVEIPLMEARVDGLENETLAGRAGGAGSPSLAANAEVRCSRLQ